MKTYNFCSLISFKNTMNSLIFQWVSIQLVSAMSPSLGNMYFDNLHFENCLQTILSVEFIDDVIFFHKSHAMNFNHLPSKSSIISSDGVSDFKVPSRRKKMSYNQRISPVFFARTVGDVERLLHILKSTSFYKGKFLIFFQKQRFNLNIVKELLSTAYKNGVSKIAFGIYDNETIDFYSWFPFDRKNKCGKRFNLRKVNLCSESYQAPVLYKNDLYNLQECSLKLTYVKAEPFVINVKASTAAGLFVSLFKTIERVTGIKMRYEFVEEFQYEFLNRGSLSGLFQHLIQEKTDVILGHLFMNSTSDHAVPGPQIYSDGLVWVAPKPKMFTTYRNILRAFDVDLWLLHMSTIIFMVVFLKFLFYKYQVKMDTCKMILKIFKMTIVAAITHVPKVNTIRIVVFFYAIYCIDIDTIYIGKLSSIFTMPKSSVPITNIELMYLNQIYVNISHQVNLLTNLRNLVGIEEIKRNIYVLNWTEAELLKKVAATQTNGTLIFRSTTETYASESSSVETFTSKSRSLYLCYYLRNYNMINKPIMHWTQEVIEKGLFRKWWLDIIRHYRNYALRRAMKAQPIDAVVYSLRHYQEVYFLLLSGYTLGILTFALEFFSKYIERKISLMRRKTRF